MLIILMNFFKQFSILLLQAISMQFHSMIKGKQRQSISYGEVKSSITQSTSHHSYISFKNPSMDRNKYTGTEHAEFQGKRQKFLNIVSKPATKNIYSLQSTEPKAKNKEGFMTLEGFCACIAKSEEGSYTKIKDAKSARQDLSSLLTSKVEGKEQDHKITPINSLLNLLDE